MMWTGMHISFIFLGGRNWFVYYLDNFVWVIRGWARNVIHYGPQELEFGNLESSYDSNIE